MRMTHAARHPLPFAIVGLALAATAFVFVFARPQYEPAVTVENIDLASQRHVSVAAVKEAFAEQGIVFTHEINNGEITALGLSRLPWDTEDLEVDIYPTEGTLGLGHGDWEKQGFERRVGNVLITYGGPNQELLQKVEAASYRLGFPGPHPSR